MILRDVLNVWLPVLVLGGLLAGLYLLAAERYSRLNVVSAQVTQIQERQKLLALFLQLMVDAENGQRGFLLTEQPEYLDPLLEAAPRIHDVLSRLSRSYQGTGANDPNPIIELAQLTKQRFEILAAGLRGYVRWRRHGSVSVLQRESGKQVMDELRGRVGELEAQESDRLASVLSQWVQDLRFTRWSLGGATVVSAILLLMVGAFLFRDMNRRTREATELKRMVDQRTAEVVALSNHMQEVAEREKQSLGRELHDSLGSLLVATKMDVAWLHARLRAADPELELRWKRIQESLDRGIDLKRRVIESLRPTLLDNMGLFAALRWQFEETCNRAGIRCRQRLPATELQLSNDAAIGLFRVAQEAFTNIVRHSGATEAELDVAYDADGFVLTIADNGRGLPANTETVSQSHGMAGMRHRVQALSGQWEVGAGESGGTRIRVTVPLANILRDDTAGAGGASAAADG